jgi:hypothetical protein
MPEGDKRNTVGNQPKSPYFERSARFLALYRDFRILRRLQSTEKYAEPTPGENLFTAIVLDVEATGLEVNASEVIELAMVKTIYSRSGKVISVVAEFDELQQPTSPIPNDVVALTGMTNELVFRIRSRNTYRWPFDKIELLASFDIVSLDFAASR